MPSVLPLPFSGGIFLKNSRVEQRGSVCVMYTTVPEQIPQCDVTIPDIQLSAMVCYLLDIIIVGVVESQRETSGRQVLVNKLDPEEI